jgi:hypothetical protein
MSYRKIFRNNKFEKQFNKVGYFTHQLLSEKEIAVLLHVFNSLNPEIKNQFYSTIDSTSIDYRRKVDEQIGLIINRKVTEYFIKYSPLIFNFIVKQPGGDSEVHVHTDDTHVDEKEFQSVNIWCPLVDTTKENGALYVMPGSHRLPYSPRGFGLSYPYSEFHDIVNPKMKFMPLKAGEAIFYNNKLLHRSGANTTTAVRPAIILAMLPDEAPKIIHFRTQDMPEDKVELFELSKEFYLTFDRNKRPEKFKSYGIIDYEAVKPTREEFIKMFDSLIHEKEESRWQKIKLHLKGIRK